MQVGKVLLVNTSGNIMHLSMSCPRGGASGTQGLLTIILKKNVNIPTQGHQSCVKNGQKSPPIKFNFWSNRGAKRRKIARSVRFGFFMLNLSIIDVFSERLSRFYTHA